jgi:hypothetical protein
MDNDMFSLEKNYLRHITSGETSNDTIFDQKEQPALETKVGQLEIKIESLSEKIANSTNTKKWVLASIVSIIALVSGAGFFIANLIFNYNQHIFNLQKDSNEQILNIKNDVNEKYEYLYSKKMSDNFDKINLQEEILDCLKNKKYWEYEECFR